MGRFQAGLKKGLWTPEEDKKLIAFILTHGAGNWRALPELAGVNRSRQSCRSRWMNYLRPDIKRGHFSEEEERIILSLFANIGSRWSIIAAQLPGRTDNEVKNFWNTHLKKKVLGIADYRKLSKERTDCDEIKNFDSFGGPKGPSGHLTSQRESQHDLESYVQEVGLPFPSFSSAQPDHLQTVPGQGHDICGDRHIFVEWEGCQAQHMILMDQKLHLDSAHNLTSTAHHDETMHAAAIRIQNKFRSWRGRKDFLIIRQRIIKIQALVRGHQVRKNYKKIIWSVGILEKSFLRWRRKGSSLCGFKSEALTEDDPSMFYTSLERADSDSLNEVRKKKEKARLQKGLAQVKSMVQYPEGRDQGPFNDNTVDNNYQGKFSVVPRTDFMSLAEADNSWVLNDAGLTYEPQKNLDFWFSEDVLQNCHQGVGSQTFPLFSSNQPDNLENMPKQGPKIVGKLSTNSSGECKEFGSCLQSHGESQGLTSTQCANVASESIMDYTNEFTNDKVFKSKEELIQWTREIGWKNGFVIVIERSDLGTAGGRKARISFCCERGGQYRNKGKNGENKKEKQLRNVDTKKCGCPFTLKGRKLGNDDNWMLEVVCGVHNHLITKPFEGRSYAGRLSKEETLLLIDMSKSMAPPRDILVTLKKRDVNNASTIKQIYNARQRHNMVIKMPERSEIQQLLSKLSEHKYIKSHRSIDNSKIIKDLFWAHPVSINMLHAFPRVLVMDTCKTNRYNLLLLVIEGVTSTNMTFVVALAYLESEREDNYIWALERLRSFMDDNALPTVIVSDKELALINAIARVFPTAKHLLSRWHIARNVLTNCKKLFAINEMWQKFRMSWNLVVLSSNEDEFTDRLNILKKDFSGYPEAIEYVINTWLTNYKEKFVSAWTDKIMHFGNLTMNRIGSSNSMLKKHLHFSHSNFETSWGKIHSLLELQHTDIIASFERSLKVVQDQFKTAEFEELQGFISMDALHMILSELKRAHSIGVDAHTCGCIIRLTHGLPCAHEIAEFKRESRPIPLESIDSYWRKLDLVPISKKQKINSGCEPVFDLIAKRFDKVDDDTKQHILNKLTEIANAESPLIEPEAKKEIHGRPNSKGLSMIPTAQVKKKRQSKGMVYTNKRLKSNKFACFFPVRLLPFIHHIKDVIGDGNCGFRAVADLMGFGDDGWLQVRKDLLNELNSNLEHYRLLYGTGETDERVKELIHALTYFESCPSRDRWMIMPDMGHLIASAYNIVLFHLSFQQCLTFLPLRSMPMPTNYRKDIAIGYVNNNHFVEVFLSVDHPVPPITTNWYKFRHACAEGWETVYISRIEHFRKIMGNNVATAEIIIDSSSDD